MGILAGATWIANEILGAYKERYITTGIKKLLFTEDDYIIQLNRVINKTVENYEKKYPSKGNFPFYHHKETVAQLSKYILFEDQEKNILESMNFSGIENIDKPTQDQVEHFYNFFVDEIKADKKLKELYIQENYKSKIFEIYRDLSLVKNIIEDFIKNIPQTEPIIRKWIEQIYGNLQKLKSSTALQEIESFERDILTSNHISDKNKAFVYFVKGLCLNENNKPKEAIPYFEQACIIDPHNTSYKAWHLYLMCLFNNSDDVLKEVNSSLQNNPFDPLLNGALAMEVLKKNNAFTPQGISLPVQNNIRYKRIVYRFYLNRNLIDPALAYFETDNTDVEEQLKQVSVDNYGYLDFYIELSFIHLLRKLPNNLLFKINHELKEAPELKNCIRYIETYLDQIKDCEKKGLISLYKYLHQITLFLSNEDKVHLDNAYSIFQQNKESISSFYFNLLKFGFSQAGEFETAIKIFNEKENTPEEHFFKSVLYGRLNDERNRIKSLITFIHTIDKIDDQNINIILDSILYPGISKADLAPFYEKTLNNSVSVDGLYKDILIATKGLKEEVFKEDSIKLLENNYKRILEESEENMEVILSYCRVLQSYKLWQGIIPILDNKELSTFDSQGLLIDALWHSKQNATKLLSMLENLRKSDLPQFDNYYIREIHLNCLLETWNKVEEISIQGKKFFPDNQAFDYYLSLSYSNQNKKNDFFELVDKLDLSHFQFPNFQVLMNGFIKFNECNIAIEHVYNYAMANDDPQHRMFFFNLFIFHSENIHYSLPIYCEAGYYVKIQGPTNTMIVNATENKNIFQKLIGKRVGEDFALPDKMTGKDVVYKIVGIFHKYDVLINEINKEAETPEVTGIPMKSFHLMEGGSVEDWNKQLMELFGKSGDERNTFIDGEFTKYQTNTISFLQLTRSVFNDDIVDAYISVTNSPKIGFRVIPRTISRKEEKNEIIEKVCIDIPTLLLYSSIQQQLSIPFQQKFIISKHTQEYFEEMLLTLETEKQSKLSLNITSKQVIPFFNGEELLKQKVAILKGCIAWMKTNCDATTSVEKLNFLVNIQNDRSNANNLVLSYVDTMSIVAEQKAVLISDEKIALGVFHKSGQMASSEWYLKHYYSVDEDILCQFLLDRNYIGIHVPLSKAKEISALLTNDALENENILQSFSIKNSSNSANVITMISTMEHLLDIPISEEKQRDIIKKLFENLFNGVYTNEKLLQDLLNLIRLTLFRIFYIENLKYQIITSELFSVLKNNNVKVDFE